MLPQLKKNINIGVGLGFVLQLAGKALAQNGMAAIGMILALVGLVTFIWGCGQYAKAKGYSSWFGALGLLSFIGLIVLFLFPDKHKNT